MQSTKELIEEYYKKNHKRTIKSLSRSMDTPEDAEDIVQEAFCRAFKYADTYNPEVAPLGRWFFFITRNCINQHIKKNYHSPNSFTADLEEFSNGREFMAEDSRYIEELRSRYKGKRGTGSRVLELHFELGYSPKEISEILDLQRKSINQAIWRFRTDVRSLKEVL